MCTHFDQNAIGFELSATSESISIRLLRTRNVIAKFRRYSCSIYFFDNEKYSGDGKISVTHVPQLAGKTVAPRGDETHCFAHLRFGHLFQGGIRIQLTDRGEASDMDPVAQAQLTLDIVQVFPVLVQQNAVGARTVTYHPRVHTAWNVQERQLVKLFRIQGVVPEIDSMQRLATRIQASQ